MDPVPAPIPQDAPPTPPSSPVPPPPAVPPTTVKMVSARKFPFKVFLVILILGLLVGGGIFAVTKLLPLARFGTSEITYWGLWEPEPVMKPLIDEYQAAHPGVKITYIQQSPREYRERLQTALSQGKGPDIFRMHNSWVPMFRADLSPMPTSVYSAQDFESTFYPVVRSDLRLGTSYVAVPLEFDGLAMYVNDSLLESTGQTVPKNWDELRKVAKAISQCESSDGTCHPGEKIIISGAALGTSDNVDHWQEIVQILMLQNNVNLQAPSGKAAEDALDYYTIFSRVDHMWDSTLPSSTFQFSAGKVGIYFAPSWRALEIKAQNPSLKFTVYPLPQLPIDPTRGEQPVSWASYWVEAVNKKSPRSKDAWDFLKFLSSKESLEKLYQNAVASGRAFGEPYSRVDMADSVLAAPYVGAYVLQAPIARSWYLASGTWDGSTGINSRLSVYFADAVNKAAQNGSLTEAVNTLSAGITQVLSTYGLVTAPPVQ